MGKRGPKEVSANRLKFAALGWAWFFRTLRDGEPGSVKKTKLGSWQTSAPLAKLHWDEIGRPEKAKQRILAGQMHYSPIRYRDIQIITDIVVRPTRKGLSTAAALVRGRKNWKLQPPVLPRRELWERLKNARSVVDVRQVARGLRRNHPFFSNILNTHAEDLLRAKQLPNYPGSNRPRSDEKRIWFFAKVLAGLEGGIAPVTATKRLAHFPRLLTEPELKEFLKQQSYPTWQIGEKK
jgi:hypothetical protein